MQTQDTPVEQCKRCGGVGEERLSSFEGSGGYFWRMCPVCDGEGWIPAKHPATVEVEVQS